MIFVTVGSDVPFDRLVRVIDQWAGETGRKDVFAQIGETEWQPRHIAWSKFLEPDQFKRRFTEARLIIAHAGMGTILTALQNEKPILVMPRKGSLGETRNEHQLATTRRLQELGKINVAMDEAELRTCLDHLDTLCPREKISQFASPSLTDAIHSFIHQGK